MKTQVKAPEAARPSDVNSVGTPVALDAGRKMAEDARYRRAAAKYAVAEEVARTLIRFRRDRGLTQKAAAQILGMRESALSRLERGDHVPNVETMLRVAEATGTLLHVSFESASVEQAAIRPEVLYAVDREEVRKHIEAHC